MNNCEIYLGNLLPKFDSIPAWSAQTLVMSLKSHSTIVHTVHTSMYVQLYWIHWWGSLFLRNHGSCNKDMTNIGVGHTTHTKIINTIIRWCVWWLAFFAVFYLNTTHHPVELLQIFHYYIWQATTKHYNYVTTSWRQSWWWQHCRHPTARWCGGSRQCRFYRTYGYHKYFYCGQRDCKREVFAPP